MSNRTNQVACYVNDGELLKLKREAAELGVTLSRYVKERLLGEVNNQPHPQVEIDSGQPLAMEALLHDLEQRICERCTMTAEHKTNAILSRLTLVVTMLDQLALAMLIHAPEIPMDRREAAGANGERRHRNWQRVVSESLHDLRAKNSSDPIAVSLTADSENLS